MTQSYEITLEDAVRIHADAYTGYPNVQRTIHINQDSGGIAELALNQTVEAIENV